MMSFRFCIKTFFDIQVLHKKWGIFDGSEREIEDLVDHVQEAKLKTPERYLRMYFLAQDMLNLDIGFDLNTVLKRTGQVNINAFSIENEITTDGTEILAFGLYMEASVFNHACHSNAVRVFDGTWMEVRAWREINTDVEEVTLSYIDYEEPRDLRKQTLREMYYFECQCEWCSGEVDGYVILERDSKVLSDLIHELGMAYAVYDKNMSTAKYVQIHDAARKAFGDYHINFVQLLRNVLEMLQMQHQFTAQPVTPLYMRVLMDFMKQAVIIYGTEHQYTQYFLKYFQSFKGHHG